MRKNEAKIQNWRTLEFPVPGTGQFVLVGEISDHPDYPDDNQPYRTGAIVRFNRDEQIAESAKTIYHLGDNGDELLQKLLSEKTKKIEDDVQEILEDLSAENSTPETETQNT